MNAFWAPVVTDFTCIGATAFKFWRSLPQMTRDVQLIVVGRVVGVTSRPQPLGGTVLLVQVDEALKGVPTLAPGGIMEVLAGYIPDWEDEILERNLPSVRHVLFVREQQGFWPPYLPTPYQNVFAEIDGHVVVPGSAEIIDRFGSDEFPLNVDGRAFEDLLDDIRATTAPSSTMSGQLASLLFAC